MTTSKKLMRSDGPHQNQRILGPEWGDTLFWWKQDIYITLLMLHWLECDINYCVLWEENGAGH